MAKYDIKYVCGHEGTVNLFGPTKDRNRRVEWLHTVLCPECKKAEEEKARKEKEQELGLPDLIGSEKQIDWAGRIRQSICGMSKDTFELRACAREGLTREALDKAMEYALSQENASWWIENRRDRLSSFAAAVLEEIKEDELENSPEAKAVKGEMTIAEPEEKKTSTVCALTSTSNAILVKSDRDEHIRLTVKAHGFRWDGARSAWVKEVTEMTGPVKDLMPDTARILLENGITVKTYESVIRAVNSGSYERECHRWVGASREGDRLVINESKGVNNYPDGKWTYRGDYVMVDPAKWREVREFADMNGYKITRKAEEMLRKAEAATVSVKLRSGKAARASADDALKAILESSRDILDDLRDED